MTNFPPGWNVMQLGSLGKWCGGGTPSKRKAEFWRAGTIPWVSPKDMKVDIIQDSEDHITEDAVRSSTTNVVDRGTVLIVTRSGILRHSLPVAVAGRKLALNQDLKALTPHPGLMPEYIAWALRWQAGNILRECVKEGTTVQSVETSRLLRFCIPIAPPAEQAPIVAAIEEQFSRIDASVAAVQRGLNGMNRMRAAVFEAAVTGHLVPHASSPARKLDGSSESLSNRLSNENAKKVTSAAAALEPRRWEIPSSWSWKAAADVCEEITNGDTPPPSAMMEGHGEVPFIKVYNLTHRGELDFSYRPTFIDRKTHSSVLKRSRIRPGDVLTNIVGPPLGKVSLVPADYPEWNTNQAVVIFRPMSSLEPALLKYWLLSGPIVSMISSTSKATAGQFNVSLTTCRALPLPIPPIDEQRQIVAGIEDYLSLIDSVAKACQDSLRRSSHLRSSVLSAAFSGRLADPEINEQLTLAVLKEGGDAKVDSSAIRRRTNPTKGVA